MAAELSDYFPTHRILSPHEFGVPQIRERLFVVGCVDGLSDFTWPEPVRETTTIGSVLDRYPSDARAISAQHALALELWQEFLNRIPKNEELPWFPIWSPEFGATYQYEGIAPLAVKPRSQLHVRRGSHGVPLAGLSGQELARALPPYARDPSARFPRWKERFIRQNRAFYERVRKHLDGWVDRIAVLPPSLQKLEWNCRGEDRVINSHLVQFRASGVRVKRSTYAPALVAMNMTQVPVVPSELRHMTTRECAKLQGLDRLENFPRNEESAFRALGNAVNSDVVIRIAKNLVRPTTSHARVVGNRGARGPDANAAVGSSAASSAKVINIRPGVSVLSVLRHLRYQPWFALAEFVDNALQSYLNNAAALSRVDEGRTRLLVSITIDPEANEIVVTDNAAGIQARHYARAFRAAEIPPDRSGLSEFGMGMKSAACWFAPRWTVRTKALGEREERTISFDIARIVRDSIEELEFRTRPATKKEHYTEVRLSDVYRVPQGRTLAKIRSHLASIYRGFLRSNALELCVNGEPLEFESPRILMAPSHDRPRGPRRKWRKRIDLKLGGERRVTGFAALREVGSTSNAGFALLRRGRVVQGSGDEGYRPELIFGRSNSFVFQRLFGELELHGFDVAYTKDGVRWDEVEDDFLSLLKTALESPPLNLLQQAREYRALNQPRLLKRGSRNSLAHLADTCRKLADSNRQKIRSTCTTVRRRKLRIERNGTDWDIQIETAVADSAAKWLDVRELPPKKGVRQVCARLFISHPFSQLFQGANGLLIDPLLRLASAFSIAEITARDAGLRKPEILREQLNELLLQLAT